MSPSPSAGGAPNEVAKGLAAKSCRTMKNESTVMSVAIMTGWSSRYLSFTHHVKAPV